MPFNHDLINNADPKETATAAFRVLDRLQLAKPGIQPLALAAVFKLFCEVKGLSPAYVLTRIDRIEGDVGDIRWQTEFRAIREYIKHEL